MLSLKRYNDFFVTLFTAIYNNVILHIKKTSQTLMENEIIIQQKK